LFSFLESQPKELYISQNFIRLADWSIKRGRTIENNSRSGDLRRYSQMELTYFVHSTSKDNEAGIRSGWSDVSISEKGREQAESLRRQCANVFFDAIFCSDLKRAVETADIVFPGRKVVLDSRLREMNYGVLNGRPGSEFSSDERECINTRFKSGENCLDVEERIRRFLEGLN